MRLKGLREPTREELEKRRERFYFPTTGDALGNGSSPEEPKQRAEVWRVADMLQCEIERCASTVQALEHRLEDVLTPFDREEKPNAKEVAAPASKLVQFLLQLRDAVAEISGRAEIVTSYLEV